MTSNPEAGSSREVRSNCRACLPCCGVLVRVDDQGHVLGVRADKDHPKSKGYMCPKGPQLVWGHNRPDRLNHPVLGGQQVTWDALLDDLADKISSAMQRNGPDGFGFFIGTGCDTLGVRLLFRLGGILGTQQVYTPLTMDVAPSYRAAELVTGYSTMLMPHWETDDEDVRLLLIFGSNPAVSHGYAGAGTLANVRQLWRKLQARGGRIWVIDPVATRSAQLADAHVAPIPGSDPLILAWLVKRTLEELPEDSPVRQKTKAADLERLRAALVGFNLDVVARRSGVEAGTLERLADDIRRAGRIVFPAGTGVAFGPDGLVGEWLRWALLILTDSLEEPGGMWFDPGWLVRLDEQENWSPAPADGVTASAPVSRPELQRFFGQTPLAALADEIEGGPLRTLIVFGAAPITCVPEPDRTARALKSLEALAVIDVVPSEATELASHVLPATGMLERADLNGVMITPYHPALSPPVVAPVAERRHSWQMVARLAERLGVLDQLLGDVDLKTVTEDDIVRLQLHHARHSFEELRAAGPHGITYQTRKRWALDRAVPEGKWRVAPGILVERLSLLLAEKTEDSLLLRAICGRQERRRNRYDSVEKAKHREAPELRISEEDATRFGIRDGSRARIRSAYGEVVTHASIQAGIRTGVVHLPHGWPEANVNRLLTTREVDPLTTQPQMTAFAVSIESVGSGA